MIRSIALGLYLVAIAASPAMAEIYKRVDDYGNVTYTNLPPPGTFAEQASAPSAGPRAHAPQVPVRVSAAEQQTRDGESRRILEAELEKSNVELARALARKDSDAVARCNSDVDAIKRELARLK